MDKDKWTDVRTKLNMKSVIFTSVICFDHYVYIFDRDCQYIEVFDSDKQDTMCKVLNIKMA